MLEYFSYQKIKKHQAEKKARESEASSPAPAASPSTSGNATANTTAPAVLTPPVTSYEQEHPHNIPRKPLPVLTQEDENFLDRIVRDVDEYEKNRPPLPVRPSQDGQVAVVEGKEKEKEHEHHGVVGGVVGGIKDKIGKGKGKDEVVPATERDAKKGNRLSFITRTFTKKGKTPETKPAELTPEEAATEKDDINRVLEDLNLSAVNNRAFSISAESQALLQKFTVILKDLVNGVPTAYDDLTHLLDNSQETLEKNYNSLPSFLKKLVAQLPTKFTGSLAPELLAVATEVGGISAAEAGAAGGAGFGAAAKNFLTPSSLKDLVTKPGAVVSMLKTIMNALKLRWPAFMGTNVLLSLGLFVLLFVFWYCHKRGREERLKRESAAQIVDSEGRIVELEDDPMLSANPSNTNATSQARLAPDHPGASSTETTNSERLRSRERSEREGGGLRPSSRDARPGSARSSRSGRSEKKGLETEKK